ncbi:MAG: RidA family protein [Acidimicrobiia bacterium]
MMWKAIDAGPEGGPPFSPAVEANGLVFVSGQASVDETGAIVPGTFEDEMRRSIENLVRVLAAAGAELSDACRVSAYVRDPANLARYNEIYREYFTEPYPARTTLTGCLPESIHFEIDAVAVRRD